MILPFKKPKDINIDTDDKGIYLYLGFNFISVIFLFSILILSLNVVLLILHIVAYFISSLIQYYTFVFLYLFIWISQIALGLIVFSILMIINKLIDKYLYESKVNKVIIKKKLYKNKKVDDLSGELL